MIIFIEIFYHALQSHENLLTSAFTYRTSPSDNLTNSGRDLKTPGNLFAYLLYPCTLKDTTTLDKFVKSRIRV